MIEEWKHIDGFNGKYEVSSLGQIKSLFVKYGKERILKPNTNKQGYLTVSLSKHSEIRTYRVHRIVASVFLDNPENKLHVNHIDGNKLNNTVQNLEWATPLENMTHALENELVNNKNEKNKRSRVVLQSTMDGVLLKEWPSLGEIKRSLGFHHANIIKCCSGKFQSMYGFKWAYK